MPPAERLTSPTALRSILRAHNLRLRKSLGQNFLCNEGKLRQIIEAAQLAPDETVLEIGAGIGTLTQQIAPLVQHLFAVEIDARLIPLLKEHLASYSNVRVVPADFLALDLATLALEPPVKALGNLPYGATSPILEKLINERQRFRAALLMVQLEVAQKIMALPGSRETSALGVFLNAFANVTFITKISRAAFFPQPEVDSALVRLEFLPQPRLHSREAAFLNVVRAAFNLRRKTLLQALQRSPFTKLSPAEAAEALDQAAIDPHRRGETLTIEEFDRLAQTIISQRD
jgi:16S rRNA (adenine1518-N6/adenine1519-N6)-dimethyltransferase